jgi:hypothetical protein
MAGGIAEVWKSELDEKKGVVLRWPCVKMTSKIMKLVHRMLHITSLLCFITVSFSLSVSSI